MKNEFKKPKDSPKEINSVTLSEWFYFANSVFNKTREFDQNCQSQRGSAPHDTPVYFIKNKKRMAPEKPFKETEVDLAAPFHHAMGKLTAPDRNLLEGVRITHGPGINDPGDRYASTETGRGQKPYGFDVQDRFIELDVVAIPIAKKRASNLMYFLFGGGNHDGKKDTTALIPDTLTPAPYNRLTRVRFPFDPAKRLRMTGAHFKVPANAPLPWPEGDSLIVAEMKLLHREGKVETKAFTPAQDVLSACVAPGPLDNPARSNVHVRNRCHEITSDPEKKGAVGGQLVRGFTRHRPVCLLLKSRTSEKKPPRLRLNCFITTKTRPSIRFSTRRSIRYRRCNMLFHRNKSASTIPVKHSGYVSYFRVTTKGSDISISKAVITPRFTSN